MTVYCEQKSRIGTENLACNNPLVSVKDDVPPIEGDENRRLKRGRGDLRGEGLEKSLRDLP